MLQEMWNCIETFGVESDLKVTLLRWLKGKNEFEILKISATTSWNFIKKLGEFKDVNSCSAAQNRRSYWILYCLT